MCLDMLAVFRKYCMRPRCGLKRRVGGGAIEFLLLGEPARSKRAAGRDHEGEPADRHHHHRWKFKHIFFTFLSLRVSMIIWRRNGSSSLGEWILILMFCRGRGKSQFCNISPFFVSRCLPVGWRRAKLGENSSRAGRDTIANFSLLPPYHFFYPNSNKQLFHFQKQY